MRTVRQIADGIKVAFDKYSDDFLLPTKWLEDKVLDARLAIMKDEIRKNRFVQQGFYTLVKDLNIITDGITLSQEEVNAKNVSVLGGLRVEVKGLWTEAPEPVRYIGKYTGILNSDDTINITSQITITSFQGFITSKHSFVTGKMQTATIMDNYIYLSSELKEGEKLLAICLLADPREIYGSQADISVPGDFIPTIEIMVKKDIASVYGLLYDPENDSLRSQPKQQEVKK